MFFRSDWPEVGGRGPLQAEKCELFTLNGVTDNARVISDSIADIAVTWVPQHNFLETDLYGVQVVNLWLEIENIGAREVEKVLEFPLLSEKINAVVDTLLADLAPKSLYLAVRPVSGSALHAAFLKAGFEAVESRQLYTCQVGNLKPRSLSRVPAHLRLTDLGSLPDHRRESAQQEILDICRDAFSSQGHSRHFKDPILANRLPGIEYILALMRLNFNHVDPGHFILAMDSRYDRVCGFSVVGKKPGLDELTYSQLLSAVDRSYQAKGLYGALSELVRRRLQPEARLLNVTHSANQAIQKAYLKSGRKFLESIQVLRRFIPK